MHTVLFLIYTTHSSASGGSFHTLRHHSTAFQKIINGHILNIGKHPSLALNDLPNYKYIPFTRWNLIELFRAIKYVKSKKPDVIHAYDHKSLFVARICSILLCCPVIFTKCGGSNGSNVIPAAHRYILFSEENFSHYKKNNPHIKANLVPNRINKVDSDTFAIDCLRKELKVGKNQKILLRISRVNKYYDRTYKQAFSLYKELRLLDDYKLVFIGAIQDKNYFNYLRDHFSDDADVHLVTDVFYAKNASRLLPFADVVVATGRGVMEAAYFKKRIFCPAVDGIYPIELNVNTFEILLRYNFSERTPLCALPKYDRNHDPLFTQMIYESHFGIDSKLMFYKCLYESVKYDKRIGGISLAYHYLQFLR